MAQFVALRFDHFRFDESWFQEALRDLSGTSYSLKSIDEDAPQVTHCISAVRYIISKSTGFHLPHVYIGDFISYMLANSVAWSRLIPLYDHDMGDLVFFHKRSVAHRAYMITHVGVFVDDEWSFFHSSPKWWKIESIENSLHHGRIVTCKIATQNTDPRTSLFLW